MKPRHPRSHGLPALVGATVALVASSCSTPEAAVVGVGDAAAGEVAVPDAAAADAPPTPAADTAHVPDTGCPAEMAAPCGVCAGKNCDDGTPCTLDGCDLAKGCTWLPADATCTDANPCTYNEHCAGGVCAFDKKNCDDKNVCTKDSCDAKTGGCQNLNSGEEHCIPRFTLTSPAHGLQLHGPSPSVAVAGSVHSDAGPIATPPCASSSVRPTSTRSPTSTLAPG